MATSLKLTRNQLASFLKDPEQIKQFERLILLVNDYLNSGEVAGLSDTLGSVIAATNANAARLQDVIDALDKAPRYEEVPPSEPCCPPTVDLAPVFDRLQALEIAPPIAPPSAISLAGLGARSYVAGTELMLIEDAGTQYQIPASAIVGSSFAMQQAARTLTNTTALQRIFDGSATGTLTLPSGTYVFEGMLYLTGMSATSGNFGFDLRGAGSATLSGSRLLAQVVGVDNNAPFAPLAQNGTWIPGTGGWGANAPVLTAGTGTVAVARLQGAFDTGGGTITPSIALQTATAAAQVREGSYILIRRVAPNATATVGNWS